MFLSKQQFQNFSFKLQDSMMNVMFKLYLRGKSRKLFSGGFSHEPNWYVLLSFSFHVHLDF